MGEISVASFIAFLAAIAHAGLAIAIAQGSPWAKMSFVIFLLAVLSYHRPKSTLGWLQGLNR